MAKDFRKQAQGSIFDAVMPQGMQPEEEARVMHDAQEAFQTQGKEGFKMMRLNMAFTPSNAEFIRVMSRLYTDKGPDGKKRVMSMTRYVNAIIDEERKRKADVFKMAKEFIKDQDQ